jgi:hypothetical protein
LSGRSGGARFLSRAARDIPARVADRLELPYARLLELRSAVDAMGELPRLEVHDDFIIYPLL